MTAQQGRASFLRHEKRAETKGNQELKFELTNQGSAGGKNCDRRGSKIIHEEILNIPETISDCKK